MVKRAAAVLCSSRLSLFAARRVHRGAIVADDRTVPDARDADRGRRGEEGGADRLDGLRARPAQRLHRGRAGVRAGAAHQRHERRWRRAERHQHVGRRRDRRSSCAARSRTATGGSRTRPPIPPARRARSGRRAPPAAARGNSVTARRRRCRRTAARCVRERRTDLRLRGPAEAGHYRQVAAGPLRRSVRLQPDQKPLRQSLGHERHAGLVAGRIEVRLRQQPRRSFADRRLRRADAPRHVPVAERGSRHQPDLVARRQARRLHSSSRHAVRSAGAPGSGRHRQSRRSGLQPADGAAWRRRGAGRRPWSRRARRADRRRRSDRRSSGLVRLGVHRRLHARRSSSPTSASGEGKEFWHNQKDDKDFNAIAAITWTDADHVIFEAEPQEWARWYSVERLEQPSRRR